MRLYYAITLARARKLSIYKSICIMQLDWRAGAVKCAINESMRLNAGNMCWRMFWLNKRLSVFKGVFKSNYGYKSDKAPLYYYIYLTIMFAGDLHNAP